MSLEYKPCKTRSQFNDAAVEMCGWVGHEEIFAKCRGVLDWRAFRKHCEYDMCSRSDAQDHTPMCTWVSALTTACQQQGVTVRWYENTDLMRICSGESSTASRERWGGREDCLSSNESTGIHDYQCLHLYLYLHIYMAIPPPMPLPLP